MRPNYYLAVSLLQHLTFYHTSRVYPLSTTGVCQLQVFLFPVSDYTKLLCYGPCAFKSPSTNYFYKDTLG